MNIIRVKRCKQECGLSGMTRAVLCIILTFALLISMMSITAFDAFGAEEGAGEMILEEGTFTPGEVIVMFREGAIKDRDTSLNAARRLGNIDDEYGSAMDAACESDEAADDAKSEIKILRVSLGDDFVIKDSIAFDEDLIVCLVSSERYDTETLIEKLSANPDIASAEPNWYTEAMSYDYSLNDTLNQYAYQTNSPADKNTAGKDVSGRGSAADKTLSARAGAITDFTADHSGENEVVVAVIDSGINYNHEELKNMLWKNPGNIGLRGEHGFNFEENAEEIRDINGHGTHVSGIIAAQANNNKGIAGVASGVNVKIMMLSTGYSSKSLSGRNSDSLKGSDKVSTAYSCLGAMNYALKARQRGVNVVAINCSWGSRGYSGEYDEILNRLGEEGIISFLASGNDALSTDKSPDSPSGTTSPYAVVVSSADVSGKPSAFTNYGKANVDIFSTGNNILSSVSYSSYFPNLHSAAERAENTEYYGQFSSETEIGAFDPSLGMNRVVPDTAGTGVKPFGAAKFIKQISEDDAAKIEGPEATCEVSVSTDKFFTDNYEKGSSASPASLKVTIKNAGIDEKFFVYFPYDKNHETTGSDNTAFSGNMIFSRDTEEFCARISCGEVVIREKDGKKSAEIISGGESHESNSLTDNSMFHCTSASVGSGSILSWDEADPDKTDVKETGIGFFIEPVFLEEGTPAEEAEEYAGKRRDITFRIDAIGVSRPVAGGKKLEDVFSADSSYDIFSGTSQATPSAAGAYAVIASLNPQRDGQSGTDYAMEMRAKLFSCVRQTDELKDLCSTGGYLDLSLLKDDPDKPSISDAICDVDNETITLYGRGLTEDLELSFMSLVKKDSGEKPVTEAGVRLSFSGDGKSITLSNAKSLIGTYTEFILRTSGGEVRARGSFFLVKGLKALKKVLTEEHKGTFLDGEALHPRYILTDTEGKNLFGYQMNYSESETAKSTGTLYRLDDTGFVMIQGTKLRDAVFDYYEEVLGYDRHQITRGLNVTPWIEKQALYENNKIYEFVDVSYSPYEGAPDEEVIVKHYLASLSYAEAKPEWSFTETCSLEDVLSGISSYNAKDLAYCVLGGKIFMFGSPDAGDVLPDEDRYTFVYSCDVTTGKWERGSDLTKAALSSQYAYPDNGKIYLLFGRNAYRENSNTIFSYDGQNWERLADIPFIGKTATKESNDAGAVAPVKDGLIILNYSVDGGGNAFLYNTATGKFEQLYYTLSDGIADPQSEEGAQSAVETADGIYFIRRIEDPGMTWRMELYLLPRESGAYRPSYEDKDEDKGGAGDNVPKIVKAENPVKVTAKKISVKYSKLRKKNQTRSALTVTDAAGTVTCSIDKITCKSKLKKAAKKKIRIDNNGNITLKKGIKKGTYKIQVSVSDGGSNYYKPAVKTVTVSLKVK